jgi:hypothetical protein
MDKYFIDESRKLQELLDYIADALRRRPGLTVRVSKYE